METPKLDSLDVPFDFTNIPGYLNDLLKLIKVPTFEGTNVTSIDNLWEAFMTYMHIKDVKYIYV